MRVSLTKYNNPDIATLNFDEKVPQAVQDFIMSLSGVVCINHPFVYAGIEDGCVKNEYALTIEMANAFFSPDDVFVAVQNRFCK